MIVDGNLQINEDHILKCTIMLRDYIQSHFKPKHGNPIEIQTALLTMSRIFELSNQHFIPANMKHIDGTIQTRDFLYTECRLLANDIALNIYTHEVIKTLPPIED